MTNREFAALLERGITKEQIKALLQEGIPDSQIQMLLAANPFPEEESEETPEAAEFPNDACMRYDALYDQGNDYADEERFDEALQAFEEALECVPEPKMNWEEATKSDKCLPRC